MHVKLCLHVGRESRANRVATRHTYHRPETRPGRALFVNSPSYRLGAVADLS